MWTRAFVAAGVATALAVAIRFATSGGPAWGWALVVALTVLSALLAGAEKKYEADLRLSPGHTGEGARAAAPRPRVRRAVPLSLVVLLTPLLVIGVAVTVARVPFFTSALGPGPQSSACLNTDAGDGAPTLVSTDPNATVSPVAGGYEVVAPRLTWTGLLLTIPSSTCDYRLELDARLGDTSQGTDGNGWGYGVGVCNTWDGHSPTGFVAQYAVLDSDGQRSVNAGRFAMPYVNEGLRFPLAVVDTKPHHWIVTKRGGTVSFSLDYGAPLGPFPVVRPPQPQPAEAALPTDCSNTGAFLRVLATRAQFTAISISGLP